MKTKYLKLDIKVVNVNSFRSLCASSPVPGGSEKIGYEDWNLNAEYNFDYEKD